MGGLTSFIVSKVMQMSKTLNEPALLGCCCDIVILYALKTIDLALNQTKPSMMLEAFW